MGNLVSKICFYLGSILACLPLAFTTGCASGGYKLTRQYSGWVNSQNIIIRIILYLLTGIIYGITLLADWVIFNTIDFWEGRISDGRFDYREGDRTYHVHHETLSESKLKRSTIEIFNSKNQLIQTVVMSQTAQGEIETRIDGKVRSRIRDLSGIPIATHFDIAGMQIEEKTILFPWNNGSPFYLVQK